MVHRSADKALQNVLNPPYTTVSDLDRRPGMSGEDGQEKIQMSNDLMPS